jgi:hypothetical protein
MAVHLPRLGARKHPVLPMDDRTNQSADETVRTQLALASKRAIGSENENPLLTTADDSLSKCGLPYSNEVTTDSYFGDASEIGSEEIASENAIIEKGATLAKLFAAGNPSDEELDALKLRISQAFGVYREGDAAGPRSGWGKPKALNGAAVKYREEPGE